MESNNDNISLKLVSKYYSKQLDSKHKYLTIQTKKWKNNAKRKPTTHSSIARACA